jgi:uncharacterized protein YkwD
MVVTRRAALVIVSGGMLSACASIGDEATLTVRSVDQQKALNIINAYRTSKGRNKLRYDARLIAPAQEMANLVAKKGSLKTRAHSSGALMRRMDKAGIPNMAAAENLGAGYRSLEAAIQGWKNSSGHNSNLLHRSMTHMAMARTDRSEGRWKQYWVLVLAKPV